MSGRCLVMPRRINVGTRNRVPMAELRSKLTEAGHSDPVLRMLVPDRRV